MYHWIECTIFGILSLLFFEQEVKIWGKNQNSKIKNWNEKHPLSNESQRCSSKPLDFYINKLKELDKPKKQKEIDSDPFEDAGFLGLGLHSECCCEVD